MSTIDPRTLARTPDPITSHLAAARVAFGCIAIEREADYLPLITNRLSRRTAPVEFLRATGADMGLFEELEGGAL